MIFSTEIIVFRGGTRTRRNRLMNPRRVVFLILISNYVNPEFDCRAWGIDESWDSRANNDSKGCVILGVIFYIQIRIHKMGKTWIH